MPKILSPVPETTESVTRPVMLDVVRQLMLLTEISLNTNIVYFGDIEKGKQLNSAIGSMVDDPNKFAHNDKITIEVLESYEPDRVINEQIIGPENLLVFNDPNLDVTMKPAYGYMSVSITVKYRANNHNAATQWLQYMKARISQRRSVNIHTVSYSYGIPEVMMFILKEIHRLRENVDGYGDTFEEYFEAHRHPKMTMLTNLSGSAEMWAMPETQTRIQGWFDFELPEPASKEGAADAATTSFTYKFGYSRPEDIVMTYPLVVHNQVIGTKYQDAALEDHNDLIKSYSNQTRVLVPFEGARFSEQQLDDYGYQMPTWDEFIPTVTPIQTRRLISILFTIDTNPAGDESLWINLDALGERKFNPDITAYLKAEHEYLGKHGLSAIFVNMYRNNLPISPAPFMIDANLNVKGITPVNLRTQHHLRIGLLTDWYMLSSQGRHRLQEHGRAARQMLLAIDPTLEERGYLPPLIGDNFINKTSLLIAMENIRPGFKPIGHMAYMNTVQSLFLEVGTIDEVRSSELN